MEKYKALAHHPPTRLYDGILSSWAVALCAELEQFVKTTGAWRSIGQIRVCANTLTRDSFLMSGVTAGKKQDGKDTDLLCQYF